MSPKGRKENELGPQRIVFDIGYAEAIAEFDRGCRSQ